MKQNIWIKERGPQGPQGITGDTGAAGADGVDGVDGISIIWQGELATAPLTPEVNWAYYNTTDKKSYIWSGTAWDILAEGQDGASPSHQLSADKTQIRFTNPNGSWGEWSNIGSDPVGTIKEYATYKDRSSAGYLPFAFDNAISQTNYSELYAEVGDMYEAEHVAAGDSASGVGLFYPTPIPDVYSRAGIPSIELTSIDTTNNWVNYTTTAGLASVRKGTPFKFTMSDGGTMPTTSPQIVENQIIYTRLGDSITNFYSTEEDAISASSKITFSSTGSGTFILTQEGIRQSDAMKGFAFTTKYNGASGGSDMSSDGTGGTPATTSITPTFIDDGVNGPVNITNEGRPVTNIVFKYIKVEAITPSGVPVSALREVITISIPSNGTITVINHTLDDLFKNLIVEEVLWVSPTGERYKVSNDVWSVSSPQSYSYSMNDDGLKTSTTQFNLVNGANGMVYLDPTSFSYALVSGGSLEVVLTKPNLKSTFFDVTRQQTYTINDTNDITVNLPDASTSLGNFTYKRTGTGTGKLLFSTVSSQTIDGLSPTIWELEGEGILDMFTKSGNYYIREFNDKGSNTNGEWEKKMNGVMIQSQLASGPTALPINSPNATSEVFNFPKTFIAIHSISGYAAPDVTWTGFQMNALLDAANILTKAIMVFGNGPSSQNVINYGYTARGRWRA